MPFWQGWDPDSDEPYAAKFRTRVTVPTTTTTFTVISGFGTILQLIMYETTGLASAAFTLYDGGDANGEKIGPYTLSIGQSFDSAYPPHGIVFRSGLFLNVTSGSVGGVVHIGTLVPFSRARGDDY